MNFVKDNNKKKNLNSYCLPLMYGILLFVVKISERNKHVASTDKRKWPILNYVSQESIVMTGSSSNRNPFS